MENGDVNVQGSWEEEGEGRKLKRGFKRVSKESGRRKGKRRG